jgi:DegV family protein with EDD domain
MYLYRSLLLIHFILYLIIGIIETVCWRIKVIALMIRILTDSTADLSKEDLAANGIEAIPMTIQIDGEVFRDAEDITPQALFERVAKTGVYPTTSAPSPEEFSKFFSGKAPAIYIGVSSQLSSTFQNAKSALSSLGEKSIELIDSLSISTGYGQTVLQAARWRNKGLGMYELIFKIKRMVRRARGVFILDDLDYLYHGGRCKAIEHFVASLLKIHPFLQINPDGTLGLLKKVRGARFRAVRTLSEYFLDQLSTHPIRRIFITHLDCEEEAEYLAGEIRSHAPQVDIQKAKVGCVLATHSGPKPIGIAYEVA